MLIPQSIKSLLNSFNVHNYECYIVGGAVRDYLLNKDVFDYDLCTNAPFMNALDIIKSLGIYISYSNDSLGCIKFIYDNYNIELSLLRNEWGVTNYRYPEKITFVNNIIDDYQRRDFTINALYMDKDDKIFDFCNGKSDLNDKLIILIGDPTNRVIEDPLRILRGIRFSSELGFKIEDKTYGAFLNKATLLRNIDNVLYFEIKKFFESSNFNDFIIKYQEIFDEGFGVFNYNELVNNPYRFVIFVSATIKNFENTKFSNEEKKLIMALKDDTLKFSMDNDFIYYLIDKHQYSLFEYLPIFNSYLRFVENINVNEFIKKIDYLKDNNLLITLSMLDIKVEDLSKLGYKNYEYNKVLYDLRKEVMFSKLPNSLNDLVKYLKNK